MFSAERFLSEIVSLDGIDDGLPGVDLEKFNGASPVEGVSAGG
jgi:hypothetical protein